MKVYLGTPVIGPGQWKMHTSRYVMLPHHNVRKRHNHSIKFVILPKHHNISRTAFTSDVEGMLFCQLEQDTSTSTLSYHPMTK